MLFPLWEHVPPGAATKNRTQGPSPLSLHPNAPGKMAELCQGLPTLQSGQITILHLYISIILGGENKNKESPLTQEQVEMETILSRVGPGPAVPTLLWNSAHCFLTKRAVWSVLVP